MANQTKPQDLQVEFERRVRPLQPAEETQHWSVQIPFTHQLTFGDLSEAMHKMRMAGVTNDCTVQVNGNQIMAWLRRPLRGPAGDDLG